MPGVTGGPCPPGSDFRRRIVWRSRIEAAGNRSRSGTGGRSGLCRIVQCGVPACGTERKEIPEADPVEQGLELVGFDPGVRPVETHPGSEPDQAGPDQPGPDHIEPAAEGPPGDDTDPVGRGEGGPLLSRLHAVAGHMHDGLEDGVQGIPATPQDRGHQGVGRSVAEPDSKNRDVLEDVTRGQVDHAGAAPACVEPGALAGPAPTTDPPGLSDQTEKIPIAALDRRDVASQPQCEYTDDCSRVRARGAVWWSTCAASCSHFSLPV